MLSELAVFAAPYTQRLVASGQMCAESKRLPEERHVQALWKARLQGLDTFTLANGSVVQVLEWGTHNRGDGPDFKNALIAIDGFVRRGDVEIHLTPRDWDYHQHTADENYASVILHVTWFDTPASKTLPSSIPTLVLEPLFREEKALDFNALLNDSRRHSPPCLKRFEGVSHQREEMIRSAGYHRLLVKAQRFIDKTSTQAPFQAFYEGLLRAMGYQRNTEVFTRLAQEVPFKKIQHLPALHRFAMLAGVGGLLHAESRTLWDLWWKHGGKTSPTPFQWDMRALRPQNHPYRRLAGVVGILDHIAMLLEHPLKNLDQAIVKAATTLAEPLLLKGAPIGIARANALVNNLFIPYRLATGTIEIKELQSLPGESISAPMREVWLSLTGLSTNIPTDALQQQGLLQIYQDFCHNDHVTCATCPLAAF